MNLLVGSKRYACCYSCRKLFVTIDADADKEMLESSFESDIERDIERESSFEFDYSSEESESQESRALESDSSKQGSLESIAPMDLLYWSPGDKESGQGKLPSGSPGLSRCVANSFYFLPGGLSHSRRRRIHSSTTLNINDKNLERLQKEYEEMLFTRENLTMYIISSYLSLKELIYSGLSELEYRIIITTVSKGLYTLSPLLFIPKEGPLPADIPLCRRFLFVSPNSQSHYEITPTLADDLVLTSLGYLMYHRFKSFCFSPYYRNILLDIDDHYSVVCKESYAHHYLLDLSRTFETIDRESILFFFAQFIDDESIFLLIEDFLYLDGQSFFVGIPNVGFFSDVLMNIIFQVMDLYLMKALPSAHYTRYMHEAIISSNNVINISELENSFFNQSSVKNKVINKEKQYRLSFSGCLNEIKSVTKCYGGELTINKEGKLTFKKSSELSQLDETIITFKDPP